jgi:cellulose synthase/poly-beta-1,6-N-acetylglucosamine synthase-like glycosyltransferase
VTGSALAASLLAFLMLPALWVVVERLGELRGALRRVRSAPPRRVDDFEVLVPIYGSVRYLENVDYLRQYGRRVVLCTTRHESAAFIAELTEIAVRNGFRIFWGEASSRAPVGANRRATSGTIRDRLVRDALTDIVTAPYVVCIDADTVTERPLGELVGSLVDNGYDFASVRLIPANTGTVLARLQGYEYRTAMTLRRIAPWQVSGACHVGRSAAHRRIMQHHSLFFQGNDVEAGLLGQLLGYRVGHIPFDVPTTVPERPAAWLRQRLAWAGGEFRLFVVNAHLVRRHPFFWLYGLVIVTAGLPLRWFSLATAGWALLGTLVVYGLVSAHVHWSRRSRLLLLLPLYAAFNSLVITPLGALWYLRMALADRNAGLIRTGRHAA